MTDSSREIGADNLEAINAAAGAAFGAWVTLLGVVAFLAVAIGGTTDVQLLLGQPVQLPLTGVSVPTSTFFFVAPFLFVLIHANFLLYLKVLDERIFGVGLRDAISDSMKLANLFNDIAPSPVALGLLAARDPRARSPAVNRILDALLTITGIGIPVLLLLAFEARYVPYHDTVVTWLNRIALIIDIALIAVLWPRDLYTQPAHKRLREHLGSYSLTAIPVLLSVFVVVVPGEFVDRLGARIPMVTWTRDQLFAAEVGATSGRPNTPFANFLILSSMRVQQPTNGSGVSNISLRGRDLRNAVFADANLDGVSFAGSNLGGANFERANLAQTDFSCGLQPIRVGKDKPVTDQQSADEEAARPCTNLRNAKFTDAKAARASFAKSDVRGADFSRANLRGTHFERAQIDGAILDGAYLEFAKFDDAQMRAASLVGAFLFKTTFRNAARDGVTLVGAHIDIASLDSLRGSPNAEINTSAILLKDLLIWCPEFRDCSQAAGTRDVEAPLDLDDSSSEDHSEYFKSVVLDLHPPPPDPGSVVPSANNRLPPELLLASDAKRLTLLQRKDIPSTQQASQGQIESRLVELACGDLKGLSSPDRELTSEDLQRTRQVIAQGIARRLLRGWDEDGLRLHVLTALSAEGCVGTQGWSDEARRNVFATLLSR